MMRYLSVWASAAALLLLLLGLTACESGLLSKVVDVEQDGEAPPVLFARLTTADTTWRVFLFEGARPDDDLFPATLEGAEVYLDVDRTSYGPFALAQERLFQGFPVRQDTFTTPYVQRGVYTFAAPEQLVAGQTVTLTVSLPSGARFSLSQNLPPEASGRLYEFQPGRIDTLQSTGNSFSTRTVPGQAIIKIRRPDPAAVNYYRVVAEQRFFLGGAEVLRFSNLVSPSFLEDDSRLYASGIFSDERARGDTVQQNVAIFTELPFEYRCSACGPGPQRPRPDSAVVELTITTLPRAAVDYYTDLQRTRRAEHDFFAEPVVLTSQSELLIAHLVVETWGRETVVFGVGF